MKNTLNERRRLAMRNKKDFALGLLSLCLGIYLLSSDGMVRGKTLFQTTSVWGEAVTYLRILGGIVTLLAVMLIVRSLLRAGDAEDKTEKHSFVIVIASFVLMIIYALLMPVLGFITNSLWFIAAESFLIRVKETGLTYRSERSVLLRAGAVSVLYSVILVASLYLIFTRLLKVYLP
jgi:hypothetical protein